MKIFSVFLLFFLISNSVFSQTDKKEYYFVFLNTNPEREELPEEKVMELQEGHMNNINRLSEEGKLITAGPVKGGGGIFVLYASSLDEANEYLSTDPAIKADRFNLEVYPMKIIAGKLCKVEGDNFEIASYTLIRYEGSFSAEGEKVLIQIEFDKSEDGIIVLNYDLEKGNENELTNYFAADKIKYSKTLWIAKGSFCE